MAHLALGDLSSLGGAQVAALVATGALVGLSVGLTGMGGGALMTPILVLVFSVSPLAAVGSDLLASVAMKPVGALVHHRSGTVHWGLVRWLVPASVPAAFAGVFASTLLGSGAAVKDRFDLAIGAALLLAVAGMGLRALMVRRRGEAPATESSIAVRPLATLAVGAVGGLVVGMTSVGSGSLMIVALMLLHPRVRASQLVGTDLVQSIPLVAAAAAGHLALGHTSLELTSILLLGALPAIYLGARLAVRAPSGVLRWILAVALLVSGLELWKVSDATVLVLVALLGVAAAASFLRDRRRLLASSNS